MSSVFCFYNCIYDFSAVMYDQHFYVGTLSPTGSCFKSPIVLYFLSIVYDVQNVSATAARQHYVDQRKWIL